MAEESDLCYCYIVECVDGTYYTGWTTDPERRVKEHNAGRGALYTRWRRPVELVYLETFPDRSAAMRREVEIKQLTHQKKGQLAAEYQGVDSDPPLQ